MAAESYWVTPFSLVNLPRRVRGAEGFNGTFVRHLFLARREQAGDLRRLRRRAASADGDGQRDRGGGEKA
jgi:hypothetical protein